jgi:hypothetical protein
MDEGQLLRSRARDALDQLDNRPQDTGGSPGSLLCVTATQTTYPTSAGVFYYVIPVALLGTQAEGSPGVTTADPSGFYALNLGTTIPPVGTQVLVTRVPNRWVFPYG